MDWLFELIGVHVTDPEDLVAIRKRALAISAGGAEGAAAYLTVCRELGEAADDAAGLISVLRVLEPSTLRQAQGEGAGEASQGEGGSAGADVVVALGRLVIWAAAVVRVEFESRPDAVAARTALGARADADYGAIAAAFGADVLEWISGLVGEAIRQVSALAADLSPVVRVETNLSLPASVLAWDLYGDPRRGAELVRRNNVATAMLMPVAFEALSS
ncbi:hypothetical protein [Jiella marina]|uniref:hypothetical protein n=1 Tax=Jiella sp. LLJ827 TaxID=2917712 RepID=UPI0021015BEB|nr:hypothetical protein [Jiella sp. LLJ827]MCQ0986397.1 hypothetical protein [Jiella sp. LLJ827]